jgi:hypothetical protein
MSANGGTTITPVFEVQKISHVIDLLPNYAREKMDF